MKNIAIFVSGSGSNCENIIRYFEGSDKIRVSVVISNKPDAYALVRASSLGIPCEVIPKSRLQREEEVMPLMHRYAVDFIVLAGFLLVIPDFLIEAYKGRIINLHPALLPKFGGLGMYGHHVHEAVKAAGERETGMTVHYVSNVVDGGAIIAQFSCPIEPSDTPEDIAAREHVLEMRYFPEVIEYTVLGECGLDRVEVIAFDADDTLWDNEALFREAEREWACLLADYGDLQTLSARLYEVEEKNMRDLGYGSKAFIISLMETALKVSGGKVTGGIMERIISIGKNILLNPATPYPGVEETLQRIRACGRYKMLLLTKGDLLEQERKIARSGLARYFDYVEVVSAKTDREYSAICSKIGIKPTRLLMVGNSFKSDIRPVLHIGGCAVHIPSAILWEHEKTEEFEHPNLHKADNIKDIPNILGI